MHHRASTLLLALLWGAAPLAADDLDIHVRDVTGATVTATVELIEGTGRVTRQPDGRTRVERSGPVELRVSAPGLTPALVRVAAGSATVEVVLAPAGPREVVSVTATRTASRLGDTPVSVRVVDAADLASAAAPTLDDALRQVPGFTLFRRSGSRAANPTAQGVSLRGVGASGASRALVLDDGIPLNDPFGAWVYWGRVPRAAIQRVEVLRGGASDLHGGGAIGGVVSVVRAAPTAGRRLRFDGALGTNGSGDAALAAAGRRGPWSGAITGQYLATDGWIAVDRAERGAVDTAVGSRQAAVEVGAERQASGRLFARASLHHDSRDNGTPLQVNRTRTAQAAIGGEQRLGTASLAWRAYGSAHEFDQDFSAIAADRGSERLTRRQHTVARAGGVSVWLGNQVGRHALGGGIDLRQVGGEPEDTAFVGSGALPTTRIEAGQRTVSASVQDVVALGRRVAVTASARVDHWRNRAERQAAGGAPQTLPSRSETAFSPRLSALVRVRASLAFVGSASAAFRPPTLNELYRPFRVGNVQTLANADLEAERSRGIEAGAELSPGARFRARLTVFRIDLTGAVGNVTLSATPELITRERRNFGRTRTQGAELDAELRLGRLTATAGWLFSSARVRDGELRGLRLPQVPRRQASLQLRWSDGATTLALQARRTGGAFEDDQNRLPLRAFSSVDAFASRRVGRRLDLFLAAEELTGGRYDVGRTPVRTLGPPRSIRGGVRLHLGR